MSKLAASLLLLQCCMQSFVSGPPWLCTRPAHWLADPVALAGYVDISRPWSFSKKQLRSAREGGTGYFYVTGAFKGTLTLAHHEACNLQRRSCIRVRSARCVDVDQTYATSDAIGQDEIKRPDGYLPCQVQSTKYGMSSLG